ncbi:MAG TPA: PAS domain S-box protein, partial [Pontiella sp.]
SHYNHFINETIEGFYKLAPEAPLSLSGSPADIASTIMDKFLLVDCNQTFASMYGSKPKELIGKSISALKDGCGPLQNTAAVLTFINSEYLSTDLESVRQDPNGNRLNLMNNATGIMEGGKLVGIWGSQRNISQQKREKAELSSQVDFMKRILGSIPAEVHVRDTRCRYLYTSPKLVERTGIPQTEWTGKTIFEIMPATPRDHDQTAIETMKDKTLHRNEESIEVHGKKEWLETLQAPLVSDEGLVEGVVGISVNISERKRREIEAKHYSSELESKLQNTKNELTDSRSEYGKAAEALAEARQSLKISEAELINREHEFKQQLDERKRIEEALRSSEQDLLNRRQQLEDQLSKRLGELESETNKRKKWEELLAVKEEEFVKLENHAAQLNEHYNQETALRKKLETNLKENQEELEKRKTELEKLIADNKQEMEKLHVFHKTELDTENTARKDAEKQLEKTAELLNKAQEQIKSMTEQHAAELKNQQTAAKEIGEKLALVEKELNEMRQQFDARLEDETKAFKQELSEKQVHEKALREHEKELKAQLKELEEKLDAKKKEFEQELSAHKAADELVAQLELQIAQLGENQKKLSEKEQQQHNLNLAEVRLQEVKLQKQVDQLKAEKDKLTEELETRNTELKKTHKELSETTSILRETKTTLDAFTKDQDAAVAKQTDDLKKELKRLQKEEQELQKQKDDLESNIDRQLKEINQLLDDLKDEKTKREGTEKALADLQKALEASQENADALMKKQTKELTQKVEEFQKNEAELQKQLSTAKETLKERDKSLADLQKEYQQTTVQAEDLEKTLAGIEAKHQANLEKSLAEVHQAGRVTQQLVEELNDSVQSALEPVVSTTETLSDAENLFDQQKTELKTVTESCRSLIDMLDNNSELAQLSGGKTKIKTKECDLHSLMGDIDKKFGDRAEAKKLFFAVSFAQYQSPNNVPKLVNTDEFKLRKTLSILLGYAFDQTEKGRLGLHATRKSGDERTANIAFDLAYSGKQKRDNLLEGVFQPEEGKEPAVDMEHGLTLARSYIELLGGTVTLEYRPHDITELSVEIPFQKIDKAEKDAE